jgi:hypothetical protein
LRTKQPTPSPRAIPSAAASNVEQRPVVDRAWTLVKNWKSWTPLCRSAPPHRTMSLAPDTRSATATSRAARPDAQAASTTMFLPPRSSRLDTRPATTDDSIPGNESSVMAGSQRSSSGGISPTNAGRVARML